ncbi:MAG: aminoacyl-tRNA hydrolase [Gammaproteobacteria bacterium]|nr:aminoacyl-tRNA hydrolase [Gammaproteobacteria bacterium]
MPELTVTDTLSIPLDEFELSFIRASGPGGQHVNKSSTAVQLRFDIRSSPSLPDDVRKRLLRIAGNRVTTQGELILTAKRFRSRKQNRQDALDRVARLVRRATVVPKKRRRTKPTRAARRQRLDDKKRRGKVKRLRGRPPLD